MFAIAFDLVVADTARHHPRGVSQAYADIGTALTGFGFNRVQGSLYTSNSEDLAKLFAAIMALKALPSRVTDEERNEADLRWCDVVAASVEDELLVADLVPASQADWARRIVAQDLHIQLVSRRKPPNFP